MLLAIEFRESPSTTPKADDEVMLEYGNALKEMNQVTEVATKGLEISKESKYFQATSKITKDLERLCKSLLTIKATGVQSEGALFITELFNIKIRTSFFRKRLDASCF